MKPLLAVLGLIAFVFAFLSAGQSDYEAELEDRNFACEMYTIWLAEALNGVPPERRNGWPISIADFQEKCGGDI